MFKPLCLLFPGADRNTGKAGHESFSPPFLFSYPAKIVLMAVYNILFA